ncbi:uncharacterized protein LY89DRAFT_652687 [Mollisia scopiformis]|uniref:SP-RING-type domain-containing protein n=1 Tax=Mollisia scopiformis TaxID=149040 RepID=A0A194WXH1_MOLSC|nr:uncharacterized protein LY89DRAFT_652687 [Mollisia scopiformis]KUJ12282.1 hypothetical protein LY89DRAFT_652687 [Mollisia scopiformis]
MASVSRRLVSRSRLNEESSPAPRGRGRESRAPARQQHDLPPYEPPACPLTVDAKRKLDDLRTNRSTAKYANHIKTALKTVSESAARCNERLTDRKEAVAKAAEKRKGKGIEDANKSQAEIDEENYVRQFSKQVKTGTEKADIAVRELIDLGDELAVQDTILREVDENITAAPAPRPARRQRDGEEEDAENEADAPADDPEIMSAIELLKKAKEDYARQYQAKSLMQRYADHNDYKGFKRQVHDAQHTGQDKPPLPRASAWFPEENGGNAEESDDEVIIESSTTALKCTFTLQYFEVPYSNNKCPHTFEKTAIVDYINVQGTTFVEANGQRGVKKANCPQSGCDKMLSLDDFYEDRIILRQVQRAKNANARQDYDDDDDDDGEDHAAPRGTQRNRPERIDSDDDTMDVDEGTARKNLAKFKREQTRGLSIAPSHAAAESSEDEEIEVMDMA